MHLGSSTSVRTGRGRALGHKSLTKTRTTSRLDPGPRRTWGGQYGDRRAAETVIRPIALTWPDDPCSGLRSGCR